MNQKRALAHLKKFRGKKILVIGDIMADKYIWGSGMRLTNESPAPIIRVESEDYELGGAANVAKQAKSMGADVFLCGLAGYDEAAHSLRKMISREGISGGGIFPSDSRPTTLKVRLMVMPYKQQLGRFDYESDRPLCADEKESIRGYFDSHISQVDAVIFADFAKGIFSNSEYTSFFMERIKKIGVPCIIKSKPENFTRFRGAAAFVCSFRNGQEFVFNAERKMISSLPELGAAVNDLVKPSLLLLFNDERMIALFQNGELVRMEESAGNSNEMFDRTGLEDMITAGLAISLAAGIPPADIIPLAQKAVGIIVRKVGTGVLTKSDFISAFPAEEAPKT